MKKIIRVFIDPYYPDARTRARFWTNAFCFSALGFIGIYILVAVVSAFLTPFAVNALRPAQVVSERDVILLIAYFDIVSQVGLVCCAMIAAVSVVVFLTTNRRAARLGIAATSFVVAVIFCLGCYRIDQVCNRINTSQKLVLSEDTKKRVAVFEKSQLFYSWAANMVMLTFSVGLVVGAVTQCSHEKSSRLSDELPA